MISGYESNESIYTHVKVCRDCITDNNVFNNFKQHPDYVRILEHCSSKIATNAINQLWQRCDLNTIPWAKVRDNDRIGTPTLYDFRPYMERHVVLDDYKFSPSTIQYIYQAHDILSDFSKKILKKI